MTTQQTLKDIFSDYAKDERGIFKDSNILSHDHVPEAVMHREDQMRQLAEIVGPAIRGGRISNAFIYGKTGTGKTLIAKQVTEELEKTAKGKIKALYINCKMKRVSDTEYRLFAELARMLGKKVPPTGLPTDEVYRLFYEALDANEWSVVLVIDEIDALVKKIGDEILYNLTRANQNLKRAKVSMIGISNNISFIEGLDPRVKSSLSEEEIIFPPYNAGQLKDILHERSLKGFSVGVLDPAVIPKCSALAAQEHGDARKALDLLRIAGELAERAGDKRVTLKHVDKAEDKLDMDRITEVVRAQPKQSLAVLAATIKLSEQGQSDIQTGDIFTLYESICSGSGLKPLTQRRISDLVAELDMLGVINARVISKGRYGRTREITIHLPAPVLDRVKRVLEENYLL